MTESTKAALIAIWWGYGNRWFKAKDIANALRVDPGGMGSSLRALYNQGILDRKRQPKTKDKYQRKGFLYKLNKKGTEKVLWLIRISGNGNGKASKKGN